MTSFWGGTRGGVEQTDWKHPKTNHGTKVAGILGAITNNRKGVASVAGGDAEANDPGVRLIQFSFKTLQLSLAKQIYSYCYARLYGARLYSSSSKLFAGYPADSVVAALSDSMLFVQAVGNSGETPMESEFAKLPMVMAVGGYECEFGGRWTVPDGHGTADRGSDYGPELSVMGPTSDPYKDPSGGYRRMVMASTDTSAVPYDCDPEPPPVDSIRCFGGTSAAAPVVASVAALIFSYSVEQGLDLSPQRVREIIEHTAEDILCDPASHLCPCADPDPSCAAYLIGWDHYSGYGRVDAGRALTLPVAVLDTLNLPQVTYANPGDRIHLQWEAFDINTENGDLSDTSDARFHLDYMIEQEESLQWYWIRHNLLTNVTSYDWTIPETAEGFLRVRLTVIDSGGNTNQDYSERIPIGPDVLSGVIQSEPAMSVHGVVPNPASEGAQIHYTLRLPADVNVQVFDVAGRHVRTLADCRQEAGPWKLDWDGRNDVGHHAAAGMYFIRLTQGTQTKTVRLVLIE